MTSRQGRPVWWMLLPVLLAGWPVAAAPASSADQDLLLPVDPNDLLILEVHAERYLASRGLIGYYLDDKVLLPLGELAAVLEYAVYADPSRGMAEGWLGEETRTFRLDVASQSVTLAGQQQGLSEPCLYIDEEDIYVTSEALTRWWPIELEINLQALRVVVRAKEPLPLITRLQREATWDKHQGLEDPSAQYPQRRASYRLAAWPFLDAMVAYDADRHQQSAWRGSLLSRGDLARLSVTGFVNYKEHAGYAWLRAGRSDREEGLLGPLAATNFEVGDVTSDAVALIGNSDRGRGVSITNRPLGSVSQFDVIDVHGDIPPGWDVELYLNGTLHDIQSEAGDGRYTFAAVPLRLGLNTVRTIQYGPSGQVREEVRTYNIKSGMWRRGELLYNYSSLQLGESILGSPGAQVTTENFGQWSHQLDLGYGLGPLTTVGLAAVRTHVDNRPHDFVEARLLQSVRGVFLQTVAAKDLDGGHAADISAQTTLGLQSLYLNLGLFDDFRSQAVERGGQLKRRAESRLSGIFLPQSRQPLSYRFSWQNDRFDDELGRVGNALSLSLSTNLHRISLGHDLSYASERGAVDRDVLLGRWLLAGNLGGMRVRGEVNYDLTGGDGVRSLGVAANHSFHPDVTSQVSVQQSFVGDGETRAQANLDWHQRLFRFGLRFGYGESEGASVGFAVTTSLAKAPTGSAFQMSGERLTQDGAAMVTTFVDQDGDGEFGDGDEPLSGVGFRHDQLWKSIRTDADGKAFLPGIQANQFTNVLIDLASIDDPFLVPIHEGMTTVVHPGGVVNLSVPFRYVGEIEGFVVLDPDRIRPLRNIGIELLDDDDTRVAEAVSEFDGNYLIQNVMPGRYRLRVVEGTLRGRPYTVPEPQGLEIPPGGGFVQGPTLILLDAKDDMPVAVAMRPASAPVPRPQPAPVLPGEPAVEPPRKTPLGEPAATPFVRPEPAPGSAVVAPRRNAEDLSPELRRALHLFHEMLQDGKLFSRN